LNIQKKNIAIFTAARSEYGPLKPLIKALKNDPDFNMNLLVGGAHFLEEQGNTYKEIIEDGFDISYRFEYLTNAQEKESITKANGLLQIQFSEYLANHKTDLLIVLGDRSELLSVVSTAMLLGVPVAHISGGEVTEGSTDNQVRHAVTKMAHLHFPATEIYKSNIMRMGEEEWRICVSGEPGLDSVLSLNYPLKEELFHSLNLKEAKQVILSTFHAETINNTITGKFIQELVEQIIKKDKYQILFTASNTDIGGNEINMVLQQLSTQYEDIHFVKNLGKLRYYSMMKYADIMLGNSSSGIIEAQSYHLPVINVGLRQEGRLRNKNVYDVSGDVDLILNAIEEVQQNSFKKIFMNETNIYGDGHSCEKIVSFIKATDFSKLLYKKSIFE
jgi:GDP/UDP-N,N'-diacetylbacillosamine 2-epimerase (hydrolysing)